MSIARVATDSSTLSLSSGSGAYDFGPALNSLAATPALPAVYELTINIANSAASNQRCSFAISSAAGTADAWDFAIQLYHATTSDAFYTLQKRISAGACGRARSSTPPSAPWAPIRQPRSSFLIRVTDAGAEADTNFQFARRNVSGMTTNWIYDTSTDAGSAQRLAFPRGQPIRLLGHCRWRGAGQLRHFYAELDLRPHHPRREPGPAAAATITGAPTANWGGVAPGTGDHADFQRHDPAGEHQ